MRRTTWLVGLVLASLPLAAGPAGAAPSGARQLAPWLDVPASWADRIENGVLAFAPRDLPAGATMVLLVEPPAESGEGLAECYAKAVRDLGPWLPHGEPVEQRFESGWAFRLGVGVATVGGRRLTAQTAVGRRGDLRVRFWALADSDDTFNRYKDAVAVAISSAQDVRRAPPSTPAARAPTPSSPSAPPAPAAPPAAAPDPAFGKGVSGVYVGLERGLSASAGVGAGQQQTFNPATGRYETSVTGAAPQTRLQIGDAMEVDVFYPDGTYRRRLPVRGLASDPAWERRQQPILWGTWRRKGDRLVVQRGSYSTSYRVERDGSLVSERERPWKKVAPHSGARLDGSYARHDYRDPGAPRLVLRPDGSYEDRGGFLRMVGSAWHLVVPDGEANVGRWSDAEAARAMGPGGGSYALDAFTLTLRDRDGRVFMINAYLPPGEGAPRPRTLVVNGRVLVRDD